MPRTPAKELGARLATVLAALSREDLRWHLAKKIAAEARTAGLIYGATAGVFAVLALIVGLVAPIP